MTTWVYRVRVETDTGSSISDSVEKLTKAQETAATIFQEVSNKLDGEELIRNILENIGDRLDSFGKEREEKKKETDFQPIKDDLDEIKTALFVAMDTKEGNLKNVLDAFTNAADMLDRSDNSLKKILEGSYEKFQEEFKKRNDEALEDLKELYRTITPSFTNTSESFFNEDPNEEGFFTDRFFKRGLGTLDQFQSNLVDLADDTFLDSFRNFLSGIGWNDPDLKELSKGEFDVWTAIKDAIKDRIEAKENMENYTGDKRENPYPKYRRKFEETGEMLIDENSDLYLWDRLRKNLTENIGNKMKESGDDILSDKNIIELVEKSLIPSVIDETKKYVLSQTEKDKTDTIPTLSRVFRGNLKDNEIFDIDKIKGALGSLDEALKTGKFEKQIKDAVERTQEKLYSPQNKTDKNPQNFIDEFEKQLGDLPEMIKNPLLEFTKQGLEQNEKELLSQGRSYGQGRLKVHEGESYIEMINKSISEFSVMKDSFEGIFKTIDAYRAKDEAEFNKAQLGETEINSGLDLEKYFLNAFDHREDIYQLILSRLTLLFEYLMETRDETNQNINMVGDKIDNIEIPQPESMSGSPSQLFPRRNFL